MTPDLIAFLNARIEEDERYFKANGHHLWTERPLREVEAKRKLLAEYSRALEKAPGNLPLINALIRLVQAQGAVYSDHPDYRKEWAADL